MHRQATNRWADAKELPEVVEAVDEGPRAQRECYDKHPQCELWREKVRDPRLVCGSLAGGALTLRRLQPLATHLVAAAK